MIDGTRPGRHPDFFLNQATVDRQYQAGLARGNAHLAQQRANLFSIGGNRYDNLSNADIANIRSHHLQSQTVHAIGITTAPVLLPVGGALTVRGVSALGGLAIRNPIGTTSLSDFFGSLAMGDALAAGQSLTWAGAIGGSAARLGPTIVDGVRNASAALRTWAGDVITDTPELLRGLRVHFDDFLHDQ